ncbi:MAG TPA: DMT family transporter [Verrucomicrobiae bacterium]
MFRRGDYRYRPRVLAAFLTTIFWAGSIVCAWRSARLIGATEANFWRLALSAGLLAIWANTAGHGLFGEAFPLFLLSGLIGIGLGDTVWFQALARLGSRLTTLLTNCFTPPFAALIEWLWLGTTLRTSQLVCGGVILTGVSLALAPGAHLKITRRKVVFGVAACAIAALAGAVGAVLSRKGVAVADAAGQPLDGGTAAFQRQLGGLVVAAVWLLLVRHREIKAHLAGTGPDTRVGVRKWKTVWPWVAANGILGQTLGVSFYQVALGQLPAGIVLSIAALTPLTVIPLARIVEGERPTRRSLIGTVIAVAGVIGLALQR